jgi:hypothetical protein
VFDAASILIARSDIKATISYRMRSMSSVLNKIKQTQENPEEALKTDAEIRESKRSIGARLMVNKINELHDKGASKEEIETTLAAEKAEYPKLFAMVLDPGYSRVMLSSMLDQLEAVERGRKTTHEASVMVGTVLVNSFVRPKLGMAPVPLPGSGQQSSPQSTLDTVD